MRTVTIELAGKERLLCFGTKTMLEVNKKYGGLSALGKKLGTENHEERIGALLWMAQALMEAGARYDKAMGQQPHEPLTAEVMADVLDIHDLLELQRAVSDAVLNGQKRTVGAEPPKNAEATPGDM